MGVCISKSKLYTRNELLYANRMANKYGISKKRYASFLKSSEYELVTLNFSSLIREHVDDSYITAWNNWKRLQSWNKKYRDLDDNLLVFLSNMPTSLNGVSNLHIIPKKHDNFQVECLTAFYTMQNEPINNSCPLEGYVNNMLDLFKYDYIVAGIKEDFESDWALSCRLDLKWIRMIRDVRNSDFKEINNLKLIEQLCSTQQNILSDNMISKIII